MKKYLSFILIAIILTNFILINPSYANSVDVNGTDNSVDGENQTFTKEDFEQADSNGTVNGTDRSISSVGKSSTGTIIGFLVSFINIFPALGQYIISVIINEIGVFDSTLDNKDDYYLFNIQSIIIGKYVLFDANIFRDIETDADISEDNALVLLRNNIKLWFVIIRNISMIINLGILLYLASRMAIATVASSKAKYKELLYNWGVSMVILFALPYLLSTINYIAKLLTDMALDFMNAIKEQSFEKSIMTQLIENVYSASGMQAAFYSIIYWILLWNEFKFFLLYMKRALTSFFLVVISPLITVTYSIDKIADKQAQAFHKCLNEYMVNIFIQPIHCYTYLVFMYMADNIAIKAPIVGVIFLMSLSKAEKIVKSLIGISSSTLGGFGDQMSFKGFTGKLKGLVPKK